jgi:signal transduction histidine kinase
MKSFDAPRREQVLTVVLCAAFCLTVLSGRILAHRIGGSAGFWPANAFLVAALFMSSRRAAVGVLIFCGLTATALQVWLGDPPIRVLTYIQWSLIEAVVATLLLKVALGPRALLRTPGGFLRIQLLAVLPACAISSLGLILQIHAAFSPAAGSVLRKEFVAHLLGMATALPALLLMIQKPLMEPRRSPWEMPLMLAALALIVALMMHQAGPMAFVISPALMFAAFRMGPRGAALANVILSIVALPVVASGGGPFSLHPEWDLHQRVAIYQLTVLSSLFGVTLGAFMLAQQARLRCLLERRAQAARAARRRAIDAGRAKTDFLATMSHEVRTPMNSILGFTDLLMRDPRLQPEARRHVGLIAQAGATLMVLLDDILDLSKVEAGQVALNPEPVDLAEVGRGALDIVSQAAKAKGLSLTFRMDDDLNGPYRADSVR